jgi:glutamate synthase domain-containing protein 3
VAFTNSPLAERILVGWPENLKHFVKVFPHEYKRILNTRKSKPVEKLEPVLAAASSHAMAGGERAG